MSFLDAIILSIVEGLTEFLPVSSTGHLVLISNLLGLEQTEFMKSFEIFIQLGAILAVGALYWQVLMKNRQLWLRMLAGFVPTAVIGLLLYDTIKQVFLENTFITLLALFFGGLVLILIEYKHTEKEGHVDRVEELPLKTAFFIGCIQSISVIPGVSRAAATIIGGMVLGAKRKAAVEFSFLLAMPTIAAATGLDIVKSDLTFSSSELMLLTVGFIGSFVVAFLTMKFFLRFIKQHSFIPFGIYRIIFAVAYFLFFI